jgi:hypothetical protein
MAPRVILTFINHIVIIKFKLIVDLLVIIKI